MRTKIKKLEEKGSEVITEKRMNDKEISDLWFDHEVWHGKVKTEDKNKKGKSFWAKRRLHNPYYELSSGGDTTPEF